MAGPQSSSTPVPTLPNNFLRAVFLQLPVLERVQLRSVCKKWKKVSDDCWQEVEYVVLQEKMYGEEHDNVTSRRNGKRLEIHSSTPTFAMAIIERCAKSIKIFVDRRYSGFFSGYVSTLPAMKLCTNLEILFIAVRSEEDDSHLGALFKRNPHIRQLEVTFYFETKSMYDCFRELRADELKTLTIHMDSDDTENDPHISWNMTQAIQKSSALEYLKMDVHGDGIVSTISIRETLEELDLWICHPISRSELLSISKLSNLKTIDVSHVSRFNPLIVNKFLESLSQHSVNLENVGLSPCVAVTDDGLLALASLSKLKTLRLGDAPQITDKYLPRFSHIEELFVNGSDIEDPGVIALLRSAPRLKLLDLRKSNITAEAIKAAVDVVRQRTNSVPLKIPVNRENEDMFWEVGGDFPPLMQFS